MRGTGRSGGGEGGGLLLPDERRWKVGGKRMEKRWKKYGGDLHMIEDPHGKEEGVKEMSGCRRRECCLTGDVVCMSTAVHP